MLTLICTLGALLSSANFASTESEIASEVMVYLRQHADREGGRKRRLLAKQAVERQLNEEEEI